MVLSCFGMDMMIYYTIKAGITVQFQSFDPDGDCIEVSDFYLKKDKTFNEGWLANKRDCECCGKTLMAFFTGSSVVDGIVIKHYLVVYDDCVSAGPRSSIPEARSETIATH